MKKIKIRLSDSDKNYLAQYINKGKHSARAIKRAKVLLLLDAGKSAKEAAVLTGVSEATVYNLKYRYQEQPADGSKAIEEKASPGQPAKITPPLEAPITALACSQAAEGRSQWTLRLLAGKVVELGYVPELSHEAVRRCLKKASPGKSSNGASGK